MKEQEMEGNVSPPDAKVRTGSLCFSKSLTLENSVDPVKIKNTYIVETTYQLMITTFWDRAPCNLVEVDRGLKVHTASIIRIALMMEAVRIS
jgi:hypothetical protein